MPKLIVYSKTHGSHDVLYDKIDEKIVKAYVWSVHKMNKTFYAQTNVRKKGCHSCPQLHQFIMRFPKKQIDHINGNGLDNRRKNLRILTQSQNRMNRGLDKNNTSGYKGVSFKKKSNKYQSYITAYGKRHYLGYWPTAIDAAKAYNRAAKIYHKEFAQLNKI